MTDIVERLRYPKIIQGKDSAHLAAVLDSALALRTMNEAAAEIGYLRNRLAATDEALASAQLIHDKQFDELERLRADRAAMVEECAKALDGKAALYRAYSDRAARTGDTAKEALMQGHALTTEDDARTIRTLKETPT